MIIIFNIFDCLEPELVDPVIDPRETWSQFLKRNIEFEDPPMVYFIIKQKYYFIWLTND